MFPGVEMLGEELNYGWCRPTRELIRKVVTLTEQGVARPSAPHLYTPAAPLTEEVMASERVRQNIDLLEAHCDPQSVLKAAGMAYPQLADAAAGSFRVFTVKMGMSNLRAENVPTYIGRFANCTVQAIEEEGMIDRFEMCLSAPGVGAIVRRWKSVIVYDEKGAVYRYTDIDAWGIQHEGDHIDGVLCQMRALEQGRRLYYVPPEVSSTFFQQEYGPNFSWPILPTKQWWAMTVGEFALENYIQYL